MQPPRLRQLAASMVPVLCLLGMLVWSAQAGPSEISTSVILINLSDGEVNAGNNLTLCEQVVWNSAKGFNAKKINFVPTIQAIGSEVTIGQYFYKSGYDANRVTVSPISIRRYRRSLQRCFQAAVDAGFTTIHIVPHVDPFQTDGRYIWRNLVAFHPLTKHGPDVPNSFSYFDTLLQPVAQALNAVVRNDTVVEFAITAEQGASVFTWPEEWRQAIADTRAILGRGKDPSKHYFGISFNWNKVCGCISPNVTDPLLYNSTYLESYEEFVADGGLERINVEGVKTLLSEIDQIGCSAYANYPHDGEVPDMLTASTMERSLETVAFEFGVFGIDLKDLLFNQNKSFVYSEQGLGGTTAFGKIAPNITFVAQHPFWGNWPWEGYNKTEDPWQIPSYRQYRRDLYSNFTAWAVQGGGPQYKMDGVFVWNVGTWDAHGVYPSSTNKQGSFGDPVIGAIIAAGNRQVNGAVPTRVPVTANRVLPVLPPPRNHTVLADGTIDPPREEFPSPPPSPPPPPPPPPAPLVVEVPNVAASRLPTKPTPVPVRRNGTAGNRTTGAVARTNTTATAKVAASPKPKAAAVSPAPKTKAAVSPAPKTAASPALKAAASPKPKAAASPALKVAASPAPKRAASPAPKTKAVSPAPKRAASPVPKVSVSPAPKRAASPAPKVSVSPAPKTAAAASPAPKVPVSPAPKITAAASPAPKVPVSPAPKVAASLAAKVAAAESPAPGSPKPSPPPKKP